MKKFLSKFGKTIATTTLMALVLGSFGTLFTKSAFAAVNADAPTTLAATGITTSDATLNGANGASDAQGHSFWASLAPFDTSSPNLPTGVFSTADLGPIASTTPFSALLSSANGLPAVTASTTYYFAAWSNVGGVWSPGEVLNFTTAPVVVPPPTTAVVTIEKFIDGAQATAVTASSSDFQMNANYTINGAAGSGQYALSATGYNGDPTPYQAKTTALPVGSDYGTNEIMNTTVGATDSSSTPFSLVGYTTGDTLAEAAAGTPTSTAPNFAGITSDKFVIVWNKSHSNANGTIGGDVTGGVSTSTNGVLHVDSVTAVNTSATADGTFASGWKYVFNITVPTNETHLSMKFADWMSNVGSTTLAVANNMRISSSQADNAGATVLVTGANTYTAPTLNMTGDLNPTLAGKQVQVMVEVAVPSTTVNGSYTTSYGVKTI